MFDSILIIENEDEFGSSLVRRFAASGWSVTLVRDLAAARRLLSDPRAQPAVVLADAGLPDGDPLDLLESQRQQGVTAEWVIMGQRSGSDAPVRAMRLGAYDFVERPCSPEQLVGILGRLRKTGPGDGRPDQHGAAAREAWTPDSFVGRSGAARRVRALLTRLKDVPFSSLIVSGETGTGKGLVARILHHASQRAQGPLVEVNCAALPRELLESELFGHEAGAFTGAKGRHRGYLEQAHGGTLFLDEIADMETDLQAKLLTAIEDRRLRRLGGERAVAVDVRVIAASNRDLEQAVRDGAFRSDLYHRLSVFRVDLPPLRERLEDLDDLLPGMIAEFNAASGGRVSVVPPAVRRRLQAYHWPGNVRELRNVVERAVLLADGEMFPEHWLQLGDDCVREPCLPSIDGDWLRIPLDGSMALDEMDSYIIQTVLEKRGYNVAATARSLGTTRETLRYRIGKYRLRTSPAGSAQGSGCLAQ